MNSPIWRLAGASLLCLTLSAQALADDNDQRGPQGGRDQPRPQQNQNVQQQMQHNVQQQQQHMQQQVQQQQQHMQDQNRQVQQQRGQEQNQRAEQQQQRQQEQQQQRQQQEQQQPRTAWQQRTEDFNQRQNDRRAEQQQNLQQNRAQFNQPQPERRDNGPAIQGKPGVAWQNQPPHGPEGGRGRPDDRNWNNRGNGWGPGPQYRPGYTIDRFPDREYRVPYRGQDFFYSGGYWYRPQGPRYVVVAPPYGIRTRALPDYATRMWIGGAMFFLAAGTYYQYMDDSQDYVVVNPPQGVPVSQPQPVEQQGQAPGIDVAFYPVNGQSPSQMEQDRYDCQRYAAQQSGFDPATATYAPADSVAYLYRQNMGNCLVSRGYQVN